jgi:hypothetical protein
MKKAVRFVKLALIYVLIIISYHNYWVVRPVDLDDYSDCTIAPVALDLAVWILTARLCYRPLTFPSV